MNSFDLFAYDDCLRADIKGNICGIDEAGRGPLAGSVFAAGVILPDSAVSELDGLNDSKKITEKKREILYEKIKRIALEYHIASASVEEIEELNILGAAMLAMKRVAESFKTPLKLYLIDGNKSPELSADTETIVKGDGKSASIAAASVLAKVERDRYMKKMAEIYPEYLFDRHKGYGTKSHYEMINKYGASPIHRLSFLNGTKCSDEKKRGDFGESVVCEYLEKTGATILERNYRKKHGEIDIIAMNDMTLMIIEVKTRRQNGLISGAEAMTKKKQSNIIKTAELYLIDNKMDLPLSFDVAEVVITNSNNPKVLKMSYYPGAFDASDMENNLFG